jgi:hypothetical protein
MFWRNFALMLLMLVGIALPYETAHSAEIAGGQDAAAVRGKALLRELESFSRDARLKFEIPAGDYLIPSGKEGFHIVLRGLTNKRIVGHGARLMFADPHKGGMLISRSDGLIVEGVEFDWHTRPYVVGQVKSITGDGPAHAIQLEVQASYKESIPHLHLAEEVWATVHDATGKRRLLASRDVIWLKSGSIAPTGNVTLQVLSQSRNLARALTTRDWLVVVVRHGGTHAILIDDSRSVKLSRLAIRSSPAMGIVAMPNSSGIVVEDCVLQGKGAFGWISTNSDGIHLMGIGGANAIRNNLIEGTQDDALVVSERGSWGKFVAGRIQFRPDATNRLAEARNFRIVTKNSEASFSGQVMTRQSDGLAEVPLGRQDLKIEEGEPVAIFRDQDPDSSVLIEGNTIRSIRGTGIRICRGDVVAKKNVIDLTVNWAITAGPFLYTAWHPQKPAVDVQIIGNTIRQPTLAAEWRDLRGVVEVSCLPLTWCRNRQLNRRVRLEGNRFEGTAYARQNVYFASGK